MRRALTNLKRIVAVLVIFCLMFSLMPANTLAFQATDISGHWAQVKIQSWIDKGLIKGYPDGTFKPDQDITRAEFMTLANRAFGYTAVAPITYTDVKAGSWYAPEVAKAQAAGYITGYPDGTMKPENPITREETATIIARLQHLNPDVNAAGKYSDASSISSWSKGQVGAVTSAKIMQGYPVGSFMPQGLMTRAEVVVASDNALHYTAPVANIAVSAITVTPTTMALTAGGATGAITATVSPSNATNKIVTWSSSNAAVATVAGGVVTPVAAGAAVITATTVQGSFTATCTVTVTAPVVSGASAPATAATISTPAIAGVTAPVTGATPTATIAATTEYTATISWSGSPVTFAAATICTATITLTPKVGYTLTGVAANFFTVAGATATNVADAGVVSAVFPATAPVQLTIGTPTLTLSKRYDGTTTAAVTAGALAGVVVGDVVTVTAAATYDTAAVGTGKTITVVYTLGGADAAKYVTPVNYTVATGVITAAPVAPTTYTLTYTAGANGTITAPATSPTTHDSGDIVTITAVANATYHFVNWTGDVATVANANAASTTITMNGNYAVTATFAIDTFTVTFDKNGDTTEASPASILTNYDTTVTLPTPPTRTGYTFASWNTVALGGGTTFNASTHVTANVTVYAQWLSSDATVTSATYTVSTGGTVTETITNVPFGTTKTAFQAALTKGEVNQTWNVTGLHDPVVTGNTLVVTSQDGTTVVTYTVTTNAELSHDATFSAGTLGGVSLSGTFTGAGNIGSSSGLTVTVPTGSKALEFTKGNANSVINYVLSIVSPQPADGDYTLTYVPGSTSINITSSADRIWLRVTAQDGTTKLYYWIIVSLPSTIDALALGALVTAPVTGATPSTAAIDATQYTGTIAWFAADGTTSVPGNFAASTVYVGKVTLTAKAGYTLTGVASNSFTYTDATSVANAANAGAVTITFPATAPTDIAAAGVTGFVAPAIGGTPQAFGALTANATSYTVTGLTWALVDNPYLGATAYTATVVLTSAATFKFPAAGIAAPTANGGGTVSAGVTAGGNVSGNTLTFTVLFPATDATISTAAIAGVTAPVNGATPTATITATTEYTATISWNGTPATFAGGTVYTATITLTPKTGYTLTGVAADFFTVAGTTSDTNPAGSGVVTAVFPATAATINALILDALVTAPVTGATPSTAAIDATQYTGTIAWFAADGTTSVPGNFAASTVYVGKVTLTAKAGYTLTGVASNSFTYTGATSVANAANAGVVTITFPATASSDATITGGALEGVALTGNFTGGANIGASTELTVTVFGGETNDILGLTKGNANSIVKYVVMSSGTPADDAAYTLTYGTTTIDTTTTPTIIWLLVTAKDATTKLYYKITATAASSDATVTSGTYTVSAVTAGAGTITSVPFGTTKTAFQAALTKGEVNQTWNVTGLADPVVTGGTLVVTAQDGSTVVTYTVTTNAELSHDARILSGKLAGVSLAGDSLGGATGAGSIGTSSGLTVTVPSASAASAALVLIQGNEYSTINYVVLQETSHSPAEPRPGNDAAYTGTYTSGIPFAVDGLTRIWLLVTAQDGTTKGYFWIIVSVAAPADITAAGVTGFVAPVTGATPIAVGALTANASNYTTTSLTWAPVNDPYHAVTAYTATVVLTSAAGYKFPGAGIAAPTADVGTVSSAGTTIGGDVSGNTLTFTVQFSTTAPWDIAAAGVGGFVAPVTGASPIAVGTLTANASNYTTTSLTWAPVNDPYHAVTAYTATVVLTSAAEFKFPAGGLTPTVNTGTPAAGTVGGGDVSGNTLTFTVQFPTTASSAKIITATTVGTLTGGNITAVPAGTFVSALKAGLTVSASATKEILDGTGGSPVTSQASTVVTATMVIKVTAEDLTSAEYTIALASSAKIIGDRWGGGIVAYILQSGDPGYNATVQHGLIAATADQSTTSAWSNIVDVAIGSTAQGTALGTGEANTIAIIGQAGHIGSAAKLCYDLVEGGYSDWYLPSRDELYKLYLNQGTIGNFTTNASYWSSTEYNYTFAWRQFFNDSSQNYGGKEYIKSVRAVRAF